MSTILDPEQEKRAQEKLARWIELDQKIVTYREISREVGVNINAAKNILARYLQANPSSFPTYILTGSYLEINDRESTPTQESENKPETPSTPTPKDEQMDIDETTPKAVRSESNGMANDPAEIKPEITKLKSKRDDPYPVQNEKVQKRGMMLVGGNELLQDKIELFAPDTVKIQLYSLSSARISDPAQYLPPTLRLRQRDDYVNPDVVGSVTGDFEMSVTAEKLGESSKSASKTKASAPTKTTKVESSSSKSIFGNKSKSRESSVKPEEPSKGKIVKKKKLRSESPSDTETEKTIEKPKAVKGQGGTVTMPVNKSAKPLQKLNDAETEKMIMESFFDDEAAGIPSSDAMVADEDATAADETSMKISGKGMSGSRPIVPQKRDSTADGRDDDRETTPTPAGGRGKAEGRVRKKRRVVKSETKMNDKGYIVTEDVSGEESYSSDGGTPQPPKAKKPQKAAPKLTKSTSSTSVRDEAPAKPKAAASKPSAAAKPKKKGQQTLAGFFKKA